MNLEMYKVQIFTQTYASVIGRLVDNTYLSAKEKRDMAVRESHKAVEILEQEFSKIIEKKE